VSDLLGELGDTHPEAAVWAAGGIIARQSKHGPKVLLIHRPRYGDWSFPKGKLDSGERLEEAALREVLEETGLVCRLGPRLPEVIYRDGKGREKCVVYWLMTVKSGSFEINDEVDETKWLTPKRASTMLSYQRDGDLLRLAVEHHPTMAE